jgi:penicillin amidase
VRTPEVSAAEAQASVAATLYEVWFMKLVKQLNATFESIGLTPYVPWSGLVWLLSQEPYTGAGASGVEFFPEPAELAAAADRRDAVFLGILRDALDALPGPAYAAAFAGSTDQDDYQWGKLHRIVLVHPLDHLDPSLSIPPAGGVSPLAATLRGFARDGTWDSVNVAGGPGLPDGSNEWLITGNMPLAAFRHVHTLLRPSLSGTGVRGRAALSGGASGDPEDPTYASQLPLWLTADTHEVPMTAREVRAAARRVELFEPAP